MRKLAALMQSWGPGGAFLLAFLDSAGVPFPVGVDALVVLTAATNPGMAYLTAGLSVLGSVLGSMLLFFISRKGGQLYLNRHVESEGAHRFRQWFEAYGLVTVFIPTLCPIPLPMKAFVICAGALGMGWLPFLLTVLAGRVPRYFALAALGRAFGPDLLTWVYQHKWQITAAALLLAAVMMLALKRLRTAPGTTQAAT